jgi:hypothetical protein
MESFSCCDGHATIGVPRSRFVTAQHGMWRRPGRFGDAGVVGQDGRSALPSTIRMRWDEGL